MAGRIPNLTPESQFPERALEESVQAHPRADQASGQNLVFTWNIASASDSLQPWGTSVAVRDQQLRDLWKTEPFLASALINVMFRNATYKWYIKGPSDKVADAVTDMLNASLGRTSFGWTSFILSVSEDIASQDNGCFTEMIRDPGVDANSKFKDEKAPVIGLAHLDSNQCTRTGDPEFPVIYLDREGKRHKMAWYQVIPFSDTPSPIEKMNGVGFCAVSRIARMAQIMRSIAIYKDELISGRHFKQMHFISGVARGDIKDEMKRAQEEANNSGLLRFIMPSILASLDPEKPVSTATIDLAKLPEDFNYDTEMKWYISCLSLGFGVDYQEFAPLPGGNIGSSAQSEVLQQKTWGKWPALFTRSLPESYKNYGVLPRGYELVFEDSNQAEQLEMQEIRTKAMEEAVMSTRGGILTPQAARRDLVARGIYSAETVAGIAEDYGNDIVNKPSQTIGDRGGNTIREDVGRQDTGKTNETIGGRLRKVFRGRA